MPNAKPYPSFISPVNIHSWLKIIFRVLFLHDGLELEECFPLIWCLFWGFVTHWLNYCPPSRSCWFMWHNKEPPLRILWDYFRKHMSETCLPLKLLVHFRIFCAFMFVHTSTELNYWMTNIVVLPFLELYLGISVQNDRRSLSMWLFYWPCSKSQHGH